MEPLSEESTEHKIINKQEPEFVLNTGTEEIPIVKKEPIEADDFIDESIEDKPELVKVEDMLEIKKELDVEIKQECLPQKKVPKRKKKRKRKGVSELRQLTGRKNLRLYRAILDAETDEQRVERIRNDIEYSEKLQRQLDEKKYMLRKRRSKVRYDDYWNNLQTKRILRKLAFERIEKAAEKRAEKTARTARKLRELRKKCKIEIAFETEKEIVSGSTNM